MPWESAVLSWETTDGQNLLRYKTYLSLDFNKNLVYFTAATKKNTFRF